MKVNLTHIKGLALIWLVISLSRNAFPQDTEKITRFHGIEIETGINEIKENNIHHKVHRGLLFGVAYERMAERRNISYFRIGINYSRLKTRLEALSASVGLNLRGDYTYLFSTGNKGRIENHTGPHGRIDYNIGFYPNWDDSHLYWANAMMAGISNSMIFNLARERKIEFNLTLPLFAVISRPAIERDYKIDDLSASAIFSSLHRRPEGAFWDKYFSMDAEAGYVFGKKERMSHKLIYRFRYSRIRINEGDQFQNLTHSVGFKILF